MIPRGRRWLSGDSVQKREGAASGNQRPLRRALASPRFRTSLLQAFVFFYHSVADRDDAVGARGYVRLVRDHDDRVPLGMQLLEEIHDLIAGGCIERTGGFVREEY